MQFRGSHAFEDVQFSFLNRLIPLRFIIPFTIYLVPWSIIVTKVTPTWFLSFWTLLPSRWGRSLCSFHFSLHQCVSRVLIRLVKNLVPHFTVTCPRSPPIVTFRELSFPEPSSSKGKVLSVDILKVLSNDMLVVSSFGLWKFYSPPSKRLRRWQGSISIYMDTPVTLIYSVIESRHSLGPAGTVVTVSWSGCDGGVCQ